MTILRCLSIYKLKLVIGQPGDPCTVLVELSFAQNRIVTPAVEINHDATTGLDFDRPRCLHKFAVHAFRFGGRETTQTTRQSMITTVR